MRKILQLLGSRTASVLCLLFAIANRIIFATLYSEIGRDARVQVTLAKNLLAGKGLGVTKYFTPDLNTPIFDKYQLFPPGFSFSIIPFLQLFKDDYTAVLVFDTILIVAFVLTIRSLAIRAGLSISLANILTVIAGCSQYTFFSEGTSADIAGLLFILLSLNILLKIIGSPGKPKIGTLLFFALIFFLPSFFRYMYLPISILFPVIVLVYGISNKNKLLKRTSLWLGAFVALFIFLMLFLSYLYAGNSMHVIDTGRGVFFDQLIHWYPYIPASFVNLDFLAQLMSRVTGASYIDIFKFFEIVNVVLFFILLFLFY